MDAHMLTKVIMPTELFATTRIRTFAGLKEETKNLDLKKMNHKKRRKRKGYLRFSYAYALQMSSRMMNKW